MIASERHSESNVYTENTSRKPRRNSQLPVSRSKSSRRIALSSQSRDRVKSQNSMSRRSESGLGAANRTRYSAEKSGGTY